MTRLTAPLFALGIVLSLVTTGAWLDLPHEGDVLLFTAYHDGSFHIFTLDVGRDILHQLTDDDQNHYDPVWSPDGERIAYRMSRHIHVMDASGFNAHDLTPNANFTTSEPPVWSPDGREIAVASSYGDILVIDVNSGETRNLTHSPHTVERHPVWSPDGREIAFDMTQNDGRGIFVIDTDGENLHEISPERITASTPRWSNTRIAFENRNRHTSSTLLTTDLVTDETHNHDIRASINPFHQWSPDGETIAFIATASVGQSGIYALDVASGDVNPVIIVNDSIDGPAWSPDGTRIAFRANLGGGFALYVVSAEGDDLREVADTGTLISPALWRP